MPEITAKIFRHGRNQAIRIPVELSFDTETVTLEKQGDTLIVRPKAEGGWDRFLDDPALILPEDFDLGADIAPPLRASF